MNYSKKNIGLLEPGTYAVEPNLYLRVQNGSRRSWVFRYQLNGKRKDIGLGNALAVPVAQAKNQATILRALLAQGKDPAEERRKEKELLKEDPAPKVKTFKEVVEETVANVREVKRWKNEKHARQWPNTLRDYAMPLLADRDITTITRDDILEVLKPIWTTKTETASRVRGRLETVFSYAIRMGLYSQANPATWRGNLEFFLPPKEKVINRQHFVSIPHQVLKDKLKTIWPPKGNVRALIVFTTLAACRVGESAPAKWEEIDWKNKIWSVPPERRKDGKPYPHRVPLTEQMVQILNGLNRDSVYIFSGRKDGHLVKDGPRIFIQRLLDPKATMHGMRSSFRDWCAETGIPEILAEKSLMHAVGNETVQAYQRSDLLDQRRDVMQKWADYLLND